MAVDLSKPRQRQSRVERIVAESLAIEAEAAQEAGAVRFMARALTQATMPHRKTDLTHYTRQNGSFQLSMAAANPSVGLPYGSIPRLLTAWVTTEAIRTGEPRLVLGPSLAAFMRELDLMPTGGRWGSITRLRDQMRRLFSASVLATYTNEQRDAGIAFNIAESWDLWWQPRQPDQAALWESTITLNPRFFDEVTQRPVPVDMRALRSLRQSPLALDVYTWLTYRMSYLRQTTVIPWGALQLQFGAEYARPRDFRRAFSHHLAAVLAIYPEARVEPLDAGLQLRPSRPHIARIGG